MPADTASCRPNATIVPQSADALTNVIAVPFCFVDGDVPEAAGKFVVLLVTDFRTYEPPVTSVPPPESEGVAVNNETKTVTGAEYDVLPRT